MLNHGNSLKQKAWEVLAMADERLMMTVMREHQRPIGGRGGDNFKTLDPKCRENEGLRNTDHKGKSEEDRVGINHIY